MAVNRLAESEGIATGRGLFTKVINPWHLCYNCYTSLLQLELHSGSSGQMRHCYIVLATVDQLCVDVIDG